MPLGEGQGAPGGLSRRSKSFPSIASGNNKNYHCLLWYLQSVWMLPAWPAFMTRSRGTSFQPWDGNVTRMPRCWRGSPTVGARAAKTRCSDWQGLRGYVPFAFRRRPDTCHVNAHSISVLLSLLDYGSGIKELRMRWHPIAPINSRVVRRRLVCPIESHPFSMSHRRSQGTADEETPLLHGENSPRKATPLPVTQICLLLLLLLSEPITSLSINPYINQVCLIDFLSTHLR